MNEIEDFKNLHAGKRLFILASGPSLGRLNLSPLHKHITMGLNRSPRIFPDTHYHCAMDLRLFKDCPEVLGTARYFFTLDDRPWGIPIKLLGTEGFSWDLTKGIYSGYTVSYFALQVAVYMGFTEIFYLGLDLKHEGEHTHFFGYDIHSHTHETTEYPKMKKMLGYGAQVLTNTGVKTYNCSESSTLDCFPKMSYAEAISL